MVFGGGAPSFDWQRATETGEGVAQFRCSGNRCLWKRKDPIYEKQPDNDGYGQFGPRNRRKSWRRERGRTRKEAGY
jgi:hypothetical protein